MNKCIKVLMPTRKAASAPTAGVSKTAIKVLALARLEAIATGKEIPEDARWLAARALQRTDLTVQERHVCRLAIAVAPGGDMAAVLELGNFLKA